jgi:predicted GNAT family acetyltransferase
MEAALMVRRGPAPAEPVPAGLRHLRADDSDSLLTAALDAAGRAFGEPAIAAPGEVEALRERLASGTVRAAVLVEADRLVAGASLLGAGPVTELGGVWTAADRRRRGLARSLCAALLESHFAAGGELAWLTAGGAGSEPLYRRLGFARTGTQLDMTMPGGRA